MKVIESKLSWIDKGIVQWRSYDAFSPDIPRHTRIVKPIFLSHKNEDANEVESLWWTMLYHSVPAYIDTKDPTVAGDSAQMVNHIRAVIKNCRGLLAYATPIAHQSWWVPLEIAFAMEVRASLATYLKMPAQDLPSYLWEWPVLRSDEEAVAWGRTARQKDGAALSESIWRRSVRYHTKDL